VDADKLYEGMSFYLRVKVAKYIGRDTLNSADFLHGCSPSFLDSLAVLLREQSFNADQSIYVQGELAHELYILVSGRAMVLTKMDEEMDEVEPMGQGI